MFKLIKTFLTLYLALFAAGCAQTPVKKDPPIPFPGPPDPPRFYFEHTLTSSGQVHQDTRETKFRRFVTGERRGGSGLAKPFDVDVCQGRVYVSDTVSKSVLLFNFADGKYVEIGTEDQGRLSKPLGITTDKNCNLYVADITAKRIAVYDKDGNFVRSVGGPDWFERVSAVAVEPDGSVVYAVDTGGVESDKHHVRVFDVLTDQHLLDIAERGSGDGQLNIPKDIDLGPDGRLYIVDSANFRVAVFEKDGTFVKNFGALGRRIGQFARPKGIAIDNNNNIYVSDASHGNFQIFNDQGQLLMFIGARGTRAERAKYLLPAGIDVDEDGRIYFVGQFFRKIDIFRPASLATTEGYLGNWPMNE